MKKRRKYFSLIFCVMTIMLVFLISCSQGASSSEGSNIVTKESSSTGAQSTGRAKSSSSASSKILVAYFSQTGHTRTVADQIHDQTGGDLFEIVPEKPYPSDYDTLVNQAQKEKNENYKPPLKTKVENMASYDVVIVGSPIWWGAIASPVRTFLSEYDFSGKTIIPFTTHEGSGLGSSVEDIKKLCPKATVVEDGLAVRDSDVNNAKDTVSDWLKKIGITK